MTAILQTEGLSKRYGRRTALNDCTLSIPPGRVVGLVGPNGAGKSTLLGLACGLLRPSSGSIRVLGETPGSNAKQLARVGFVAQDTPVYAGLTVAEHLRLGARLNPGWDQALAERRIQQVRLDPAQKGGRLSGGQRAQLALTLAAAKRPELLIFDEPVSALDPLARRAFLRNLMEFVSELEVGVVLSSHVLSDLEQTCDYLVILIESEVQLAGEVDDLLSRHYRLTGDRGDLDTLPDSVEVIQAEHTARHSSAIVHAGSSLGRSVMNAEHVSLEEMVLAYLTRADGSYETGFTTSDLEAQR